MPANAQAVLAPVLDEQGDWEAFSRPLADAGTNAVKNARANSSTSTHTWESFVGIEGMHCAACSLTVEQALRSVAGVQDASVNAASGMARVIWSSAQTRPSQWFSAVQRAGYQAVPAVEAGQLVERAKAARLMLWRWLVAGFCMMQVMMYAVPSYLAAPGEMTPDLVQLMRWASWVLTLPVLLFSCRPFFESAARDLRHARVGMDVPVALGIVIAFAASSAGTFGGAGVGEVWYDSITMFVFFLLSGRMLELRLRDRTAGALEALSRRVPDSALRRGADDVFARVAVRRLKPGDVIRVLPGEAFAADGELLEGHTQVDEALLTGESRPLQRGAGQRVLAGSYNLSGVVLMRVQAGAQTRYAGMVALMQDASTQKPELARLADRLAGPFLAAVIAASALACAGWWPSGAGHAIGVAIAVLIVTCPCALSLATPAAMLAAAGALASGGVLVRRLQALETAARIDTVIFDKTGTLTHDRMSVGAIRTRAGHEPSCMLALAASLASQSLHPASRALAEAAGSDVTQASGIEEFAGQGLSGWVSTGTDTGLMQLRLGSAAWCNAPQRPGHGQVRGDAHQDMREVHLSDAQGWLASFQLEETVRDDALASLNELKSIGLQVHLLSGDRSAAVERLAWRLDIDACWGERSPEDKLAYVRQLQEQGHRVAMVGDGINDAPVLARADVSMSFAQAAPISRAQADFVLLGSHLAPVAAVLRQARRSRQVVRQNLLWAAGYNAVCVPLAIAGLMPPWLAGLGMAASSLLVVLNAARLARLPQAPVQAAPVRLATN
jgi:Cu2+-exporting ATPase